MGETLIKNLDEIISQRLSSSEIITKTEISNLLQPGENYMSEMMKVDVHLKNNVTEAEREIHAVAKCVTEMPGSGKEESMKDIPNDFMPSLFIKEIAFYKEVVPAIQTLLKNKGMSPAEYFPEYYGGRLNLTGNSKADKDAVLLLENLHTSGFQNMDRHVGFDFDEAKMVLKDLAHLHAVCIAVKLLEPELFEEKIKKNCNVQLTPPPPPPPSPGEDKPKGPMEISDEVYRDILDEDEECKPAIPIFLEILKEQKKLGFESMFNQKPREPFASLTHSDMWMNNTMQKLDSQGRPVKNKFVDFQMYNYSNPMRDLQFLLQTSVQLPVLKTQFDYLMKYYHDNFTKVLGELGCDVAPFNYDKLLEEVKAVMPSLLTHGSFMLLMIVFGTKGKAADPGQMHKMNKDDIDPRARAKFQFIVREAYKRGWLL